SDANALLPAIEDAGKRDIAPTELLADTLYGGDDNVEKAKELGITVIAPVMGAKEGATALADFTFSDTDRITACPEQQAPIKTKSGKQGGTTVYFDKAVCDKCCRQSECPVKRDKKSCTISYDAKSLRLSRRRKLEKEKAFTEKYRYRSGIEGTMSDLDRITGIKHLRVRGMPQVRLAAVLKATGLNILRAMAFKNRLQRPKKENEGSNPSPNGIVGVVKEQILQILGYLRELPGVFLPDSYQLDHFMPQTA
ncbi:MAG: transposase, partial [Geobacteraceae bacterium]